MKIQHISEYTAKEKGYDKFNDIGKNMWELIRFIEELPNDVIVYFLGHIDTDDNGREKFKTIGKLLDEKCLMCKSLYNSLAQKHIQLEIFLTL